MSRDRMVMIRTYIGNGERYLQSAGLRDEVNLAMENFRRAEEIAREDKLDAGLALSDCDLARGYRRQGDMDRALACSNQAVTLASEGDDDSVQVLAYGSLGNIYGSRNEKLSSFRSYLKALDIAEQSKKDVLIRGVLEELTYFYQGIHEYDKAIDYALKTADLDRGLHHPDDLSSDYSLLGSLYADKKEYDISLGYYEHEAALGDSIHLDLVDINAYFGIFNLYFNSRQYKKGMIYLDQHPLVMDFIDHAGLHFYIDEYYGAAYVQMGKLDSADFYFRRAEPQVRRDQSGTSFHESGII